MERGVVTLAGAGAAEGAAVDGDFAFEIDAFAALGADDAGTFEAGKIFGVNFDADPLLVEQFAVGNHAVGLLLAFLFVESGEHFDGALFGIFAGDNADGATRLQIEKRGGDFAPIEKFQSALAEAASGDESDSVRHAAVDFNVGDEALSFADGIFDAEFAEAEHGEADA